MDSGHEETRNLFWGVDLQRDFMDEDGKLYVPDAEAIRPNVQTITDLADKAGSIRVMSADDHEYHDPEITLGEPDPANGLFNPHCMRGTQGAMLIPEADVDANVLVLYPDTPKELASTKQGLLSATHILIPKKSFDVFTNPYAVHIAELADFDNVYVYGVATDVCVKAAYEGLVAHGHPVTIITDAIAGIVPENVEATLAAAKAAGVRFITTAELVEEAS